MKQTIFVTGGSGFIAGHFLRRLVADGDWSVCCLSRHGSDVIDELSDRANFRFLRGGLLDGALYEPHLAEADVVVHLAAVTGKAARRTYFDVNVEGTAYLLERCRAAGRPKFLFTSTIAVKYDDIRRYHYAQSKRRAEEIVRESGLEYTIIRPTIVLGRDAPGWASLRKMASARVLAIPGSGRAGIQPILVDDLVSCMLFILREGVFENEVLELGGPESSTLEAFLVRIHRRVRGKQPRVVHLPLRLMTSMLGLAEPVLLRFLPVSAGQLSVFGNDGLAADNAVLRQLHSEMTGLDEMMGRLIDDEPDTEC